MAAAELADLGIQPDEELIERVARGDEAAFEALYDRYFPRVFSFVRKRLGNRADTEETVQEVFLSVFGSMASYRGDAPFAAWVLGVTRRTIAARFKKKRHATVPFEGADEAQTIDIGVPTLHREPTPYELYECGERLASLADRARRKLTPEQRTLFELHHLEHLSIHDIARTLHKSEDAVKSNLYRARKLLLAR
jgi:RNA polymerase sigma-70 factor (ECF subfamily)